MREGSMDPGLTWAQNEINDLYISSHPREKKVTESNGIL
jgi:hypothetical protein